MRIETIKSRIEHLNTVQKKDLIAFIKSSYNIFDEYSTISNCPHCNSNKIIKNGTRNSINRYLCKDCKKSFTYKSKSVLSGIHKVNKWNDFVDDFLSLNISSLKTIKKKLKISEQTAFNWRHKLIAAINIQTPSFSHEEVEFDEAYYLISRKGRKLNLTEDKRAYRRWRKGQVGDTDYNVKIFFAYGRNRGNLELCKSHMGRTKKDDLKTYFKNRFDHSDIYTDKHPTYRAFFNQADDINHGSFLARNHIDFKNPVVHNQTVNAYTKGFKNFVNIHLKGVSTKYIEFYAKWYQFIIQMKGITKIIENNEVNMFEVVCNSIVKSKDKIWSFRETEMSFLKFLKKNGRTNYGTCRNHYYRKFIDVITQFDEVNLVLGFV